MGFAAQRLQEIREDEAAAGRAQPVGAAAATTGPVLRPEPENAFTIERTAEGFQVRGKRIERLAAMTNPENEEGMARLEGHLRRLGVLAALERAGVEPGDRVDFGTITLDWGEEM
jgi:GTP-binding protein